MTETIFKIIFLVLLILANLIRIYYSLGYKKQKQSISIKRKKELAKVILFYVSFAIPSLIYIFTNWIDFFSFRLHYAFRLLGISIIILGMILFTWTHKTLKENFSPILEIKKNHKLIEIGPYKRIRHPMYTSLYLLIIGFFLLSLNWLIGIVPLLGFSFLYLTRVRNEEKMMLETFGEKYNEYMKRTGRLLPKLRI